MSRFRFETHWTFDATIGRVWDLIKRPERFPEWWPGF